MTELILIVGLLALLATLPIRFAAEPATGGEPQGDPGADGDSAAELQGEGQPDGAQPDDGQPETAADSRSLVKDFLRREPTATEQPTPVGEGQAPAEPGRQPETPFGAPPETPAELDVDGILQALELSEEDFADVPEEHREVVKELTALVGKRWYEGKYQPAGLQVAQRYQAIEQTAGEQQQWYKQINEFCATPAYQFTAWCLDNPQLFEQVWQYADGLATGQAPPTGDGEQVNIEELDPEMRRLHESQQQAQAREQELRGWVGELHEQFTRSQEEAGQRASAEQQGQARVVAEQQAHGAYEFAKQRLGFDPLQYPKEFEQAKEYVANVVHGALYRWQRETGGQGAPPQFDVSALLWDGLRHAGFGNVYLERKRQAETSASAPGERSAAGPEPHVSDEKYGQQLTHQAIADMRAEGIAV